MLVTMNGLVCDTVIIAFTSWVFNVVTAVQAVPDDKQVALQVVRGVPADNC